MPILFSPDNHKYLDYTDNIYEICRPLFRATGINNFLYIKVYRDKKRLQMGTNPNWLVHYLEQDYYLKTSLTTEVDTRKHHFILYQTCMDNIVFQAAVNDFKMHHGIVLASEKTDGIEYFHFSTKEKNQSILNYYINNTDSLERFSLYFKEKALKIIKDIKPLYCKSSELTNNGNSLSFKNIDHSIPINQVEIELDSKIIRLTGSEVICLSLYLRGMTTKEISLLIYRSPRTIEHHIKNIKEKLNAKTRSEIFKIIEENGLLYILRSSDHEL